MEQGCAPSQGIQAMVSPCFHAHLLLSVLCRGCETCWVGGRGEGHQHAHGLMSCSALVEHLQSALDSSSGSIQPPSWKYLEKGKVSSLASAPCPLETPSRAVVAHHKLHIQGSPCPSACLMVRTWWLGAHAGLWAWRDPTGHETPQRVKVALLCAGGAQDPSLDFAAPPLQGILERSRSVCGWGGLQPVSPRDGMANVALVAG